MTRTSKRPTRAAASNGVVPSYHSSTTLKRFSRERIPTLAARQVTRTIVTPGSFGGGWVGKVDNGLCLMVDPAASNAYSLYGKDNLSTGGVDNGGASSLDSNAWTSYPGTLDFVSSGIGAMARTVASSVMLKYTGTTLSNQGLVVVGTVPIQNSSTTFDDLFTRVLLAASSRTFSAEQLRRGVVFNCEETSEEAADMYYEQHHMVHPLLRNEAVIPATISSLGAGSGFRPIVIVAEGLDSTASFFIEVVRHVEIQPTLGFQALGTPGGTKRLRPVSNEWSYADVIGSYTSSAARTLARVATTSYKALPRKTKAAGNRALQNGIMNILARVATKAAPRIAGRAPLALLA